MTKINKTRYAVLGILALGPTSGYGIKKMMAQSTTHFWREGDNSIYPILKQLLHQDAVTCEVSQKGTFKKIYQITTKGREDLEEWLQENPILFQNRNELLLKIFLGSNVKKEFIIKYIENFRFQVKAKLETSEKMAKKFSLQHHSKAELFQFLTLKAGIIHYQANLKWCDEALALIREHVT